MDIRESISLFILFKTGTTINNHDVISIYPGKIAGIIHDRPPYGNAIIIETDINSLDVEIREFLLSQYPDNPLQNNIILQCPKHFLQDRNISKNDLSSIFFIWTPGNVLRNSK